MTAIQSLYSRQTFEYDLNDRIIKETQNSHRIERTYDDEAQTLTRMLYIEGKYEPIITQFKYNSLGELIELNLPDTSGQKKQLFFQYDQNGNETDRTSPQGFILKQRYDAMDCLVQQRAGWEPTQFFDKDELRATGIDAPSFAEVNQHYRYDKALNTLETKDKGKQLYFTLNKNNQITQVHNQNREQERYAYDECGYLTQRRVGHENYGLIQNPHHPEFHAQRQIIQHQDIYQKGHKLHRLNENYYEYDKAGRLVTKVEKRDGFRKQETDYRWNGKNELIGITTPKGEVWHYKYDAFGRRISKECPQQHLRIEYLWDGDQITFTRTFKNDELVSERHSVFNGFKLIAQQDHYQQLKQTIDGNFIEWKQETGYAICQPNGLVFALLNPQGRTLWRREKQTLWGLLFSNEYRQSNPLDPQMLFAGQWLDEESGLAYNRFRYYDPETSNYLSSDPIGLDGGETPYSYVQNSIDFIDPFGLASCRRKYMGNTPSKNSRTGREVIERMRAEGKIRTVGKRTEFYSNKTKQWHDLSQADMAHKTAAVSWWNSTGRQYGARAPEIRKWMKNSRNYELEHFSINRSEGAKIRETYLLPLK